jgi:phospholipase/carboxylesterase
MSVELLECVEREPKGRARAAVIWLHGLGADGYDFYPLVPQLGVQNELGVRFVFPHAPLRAVTINNGLVMRAWYDVRGFDLGEEEDEKGLRDSEARVRTLVEREVERGIEPPRIVLAGFSQGGAIALQTLLRYPQRLAGGMVLSAYLTLPHTLEAEASEANLGAAIFMAHGTRDPIVPLEAGKTSAEALSARGYRVNWRTYPMEHQVCPQEVEDIAAWLREVVG